MDPFDTSYKTKKFYKLGMC